MIVDYLSITMSEESFSEVEDSLTPIISQLGVLGSFDGILKLISGGTFKTGPTRGSVYHVSASGDFLTALRAHNLYQNYLSVISHVPHRVTRMDVACDVPCDSPLVLKRLTKRAHSGDIRLTRNKIDPQRQVKTIMGLNPEGKETGSLYLGPAKPQIASCKIYDKRQERWQRANLDIPPLLRYELKLGRKANLSLRDAWEPDPVFWHFMQDLLPAPEGVPEWVPHGEGFTLPPSVTLLPAESMKRLLETSDLTRRLLVLSDQIGAHGFDYLLRLMKKHHQSHTINKAAMDQAQERALEEGSQV